MNSPIKLLDETLKSLKDFQCATVKAVIDNFNGNGSQRILVADEVGLGKTIVAKGVIAELLKKHLVDQAISNHNRPLRVTYICSNLTLANENCKKLAVFKGDAQRQYVQSPTYNRLLQIAALVKLKQDASDKILELCSLTPSTSFNLSNGHGNRHERLIIYFALLEDESLSLYEQKLSEFFSVNVGKWEEAKQDFKSENYLDEQIVKGFHEILKEEPEDKVKKDIGVDQSYKTWRDILLAFCKDEMSFKEPIRLRRNIRFLLARSCAKHLSADLFILDEFQRFKSLLDTTANNDESLIAKEVFHPDRTTKVLLLSATPFKALSHTDEDEKGNTHSEELKFLLQFISRSNDEKLAEYEKHRHEVQLQILSLRDITVSTKTLNHENKDELEKILSQYICRTERAQMCESYENVLDKQEVDCAVYFTQQDIEAFNAIDKLGLSLQKAGKSRLDSQLMEFYKATPWPLSFLSGYQFKLQLDTHRTNVLVKKPLIKSKPAWLSYADIQEYKTALINAPHAKTRALVSQIFKTPSEELLWVPPSLPHYPLQGSFENQSTFSKTLLFSSWAMVPRALSGLISYEAERRLLLNRKGLKKAYHKEIKHSPKIKFDSDASLSGWSLIYPSKTLLDMPLTNDISDLSALIIERTTIFKSHLENMNQFATGTRTGDRWFALAPMLLDKLNGHDDFVKAWLDQELKNTDQTGREKHLKSLKAYLDDDNLQLGPMPEDLAQYLAQLSIAGPAACIARTWHSLWPDETEINIARAATQSAFAAVAMFNKPEAESILSKRYKSPKVFQSIVRYCADGGFQSVIDEYGHLLKDAGLPMIDCKNDNQYSATKRLIDVFEFRTSSVACQFLERKNETSEQVSIKAGKLSQKHTLRCHYAVPLGNQKMADDKGVQRVSAVRDAFNSPFRPFMLNSTSIGQEGLDFHWYCHHVVHWNIPINPIDIEQREGRVNRYKSLVVRKRIAQQYKSIVNFDCKDTWDNLFEQVDSITKKNGRKSDLVPYWHIPEGDAKIERYVPMLPMSKDMEKFKKSLEILSLYRLAFGQPRQEELLDNLLKRNFSPEEFEQIKNALVINLSPMMHKVM